MHLNYFFKFSDIVNEDRVITDEWWLEDDIQMISNNKQQKIT